jgi:hypothetical protein
MTMGEAHLIARMQVALVEEGILHSIAWTTVDETQRQRTADELLIQEAVIMAWPLLMDGERSTVRHWGPQG